MQRIDINERGFSPVGDIMAGRSYEKSYSDFSLAKHNTDMNAHEELFSNMNIRFMNTIDTLISEIELIKAKIGIN